MPLTLRGSWGFTTRAYFCLRSSKKFMSTSLKQLSSSSQQRSSSSGSNDLQLDIGGHRWLRLLLLAVVLYVIFLPLWWMTLDQIAWFSATCADFIYHAFNSQVAINPNGKIITVAVRIPEQAAAEPYKLSLKMD